MLMQCLLAAGMTVGAATLGPVGVGLGYIGTLCAVDAVEYGLNCDIRNQKANTGKCYDWYETYGRHTPELEDYSEGLFRGNFKLSTQEATKEKFDFIFKELDLKAGMKVLDAGCGNGAWMTYLKEKKVDVVGLTLSDEQMEVIAGKGFERNKEVFVRDYTQKYEDFVGKFDRVTALGSSEHVCSSVGILQDRVAAERCIQIRAQTWSNFRDYLKTDEPSGSVYITSLVINPAYEWGVRDYAHAYLMDRHYSGYYSSLEDVKSAAIQAGFTVENEQDFTADYHWASVINYKSGGYWNVDWRKNTQEKILSIPKALLTDPYFMHRWAHYYMRSWLWQFGGSTDKPLTPAQVEKSPAQLKYFIMKKSADTQSD